MFGFKRKSWKDYDFVVMDRGLAVMVLEEIMTMLSVNGRLTKADYRRVIGHSVEDGDDDIVMYDSSDIVRFLNNKECFIEYSKKIGCYGACLPKVIH